MKKTITFYILLLTTCYSYAQADLTVSVINYLTNQPVTGIEVKLENVNRGFSRAQMTDEQGKAIFKNIAELAGYKISIAESELYSDAMSGEISIRSNQNPTIQLGLFEKRSVDLAEVVVQGASTTQINRTDAEVAFELKQKDIEQIPIEGRDITRVLYRLPNVSQATGFYPEAPNVSINGANALFTSYLIDGMDNNERFLGGQKFAIPVGFARNVTVLTNNYSAEYGLTNNGVINITTRSGSNEFTGEAFLLSRPGPVIDAKSDFTQRDLSGNFVKDGFQRYQAGFGFGGAITPDKTFYYINYEHTTDLKDNLLNSPALRVNETVRGTNNFNYLSAKLDHNWSTNFNSSLRVNYGLVNVERQGGGLDGGNTFQSAGNKQDRNSLLVALKNNYVSGNFSSNTNVQFARFRWNYARALSGNDGPQVVVQDPTGQTAAILGHPGYFFDETENTLQFQQKFGYYAGNHNLKGGVGIISADHQLVGGGNGNGNYLVRLNQAQLNQVIALNRGADLGVGDIPTDVQVLSYDVELRPAAYGKRQNIYSAYVEDQWSVTDRLNLTLGLRYDYDDLSKGGSAEGDLNNIAPRFNFNYKLGQHSSLRGGYGIFYDKILYAIYSDALQQNTNSEDYKTQIRELVRLGILPADTDVDRVTFAGNANANVANVTYLQGPSGASLQDQRERSFSNERRILNPNGYDNPYTHQLALGYQLQIKDRTLFFVDLVHNQSFNLFRVRNLNAVSSYPLNDPDNVVVRTPAQADATRPIPITNGSATIGGKNVTGVARNVVVTESGGESRYYAASFNLQHSRGENEKFAYLLNYTLSYLENNTEDINFRAANSNNFDEETGPSINDRRHIINAIVNYFPTDHLSVTLATLLQSGQPINRIPDATVFGTTDLNGDGASFGDAYVGNSDRYPGESRNNDRLPWSNNFDVGIQYAFPLGSNNLEVRADIFNVFDIQNLSGYSNNATQSNQIQVGSKASGILVRKNASAPRQFQFGLRYVF